MTTAHKFDLRRSNTIRVLTQALCVAGLAASCASVAAGSAEQDNRFLDGWREGQVETIFMLNPYLNNFEIDAEVTGEHMVLNGEVDEAIDRDLAEAVASGMEGITSVENRIAVVPGHSPRPDDSASEELSLAQYIQDITTTTVIKGKLVKNPHISGFDISVDTTAGHVTLTGEVDSGAARDLSWRLARNTQGVVSVDNQLSVNAADEQHTNS